MICYRDMTFCSYWKECEKGLDCCRALTSEVRKGAKEWWGTDKPPICMFATKPSCFKLIEC